MFAPGDLVRVYESRYKRMIHSNPEDRHILGIVLGPGLSNHYYRVVLFVRHYDTGERIIITHYKNMEVFDV